MGNYDSFPADDRYLYLSDDDDQIDRCGGIPLDFSRCVDGVLAAASVAEIANNNRELDSPIIVIVIIICIVYCIIFLL